MWTNFRPLLRCLLACLAVALVVAPAWGQNGRNYRENGKYEWDIEVTANGAAAAQAVTNETPPPAGFPFLSPDYKQRNLLVSAYQKQGSLFGGIAGKQGKDAGAGGKVLFYLAVFGTMVGALLILFFPKYQRKDILLSWLLVVTILVFAPYNSKLLFYPVISEKASDVSCSGSSGQLINCGFTPQLAAIHLASTLQVTFSDLFRSPAWMGLGQAVNARINLESSPYLTMDKRWFNESKDFTRLCRDYDANNLDMKVLSDGNTSSADDDGVVPMTLGEVWSRKIDTFYRSSQLDRFQSPPPVITLYETAPNNFTEAHIAAYQIGMTRLYNLFGRPPDALGKTVMFEGSGGNIISMKDALKGLSDQGFFDVYGQDGRLSPGFFFSAQADLAKGGSGQRIINKAKVRGGEKSQLQSEARVCYGYMNATDNSCKGAKKERIDAPNSPVAHWRDYMAVFEPEKGMPPPDKNSFWPRLRDDALNSSIANMPIGFATAVFDQNGKVSFLDAPGYSCKNNLLSLTQEAVRRGNREQNVQDTQERNGVYLPGLEKLLKGESTVNGINVTSELLAGDAAKNLSYNGKQLADNLAIYLTSALKDANSIAENNGQPDFATDDDAKRKVLNRAYFDVVSTATANFQVPNDESNPNAAANANSVVDGKNVAVFGNETLTSFGSGVFTLFAKVAVKIGAVISGAMAATIVKLLMILVDLSLTALIIMTPFMLLAGVIMPSAAAGVLTISVLGIFVLKFVPVTLIILNALGGVMMQFMVVSSDPEAGFIRDAIVLAMSGMYAGIVTLTFFMLFKMGDPAAFLGRMTALDGAAKEMADTGRDLAMVAGTAAATVGMAGFLGAAGAAWGSRIKTAANLAGLGGIANKAEALQNAVQQVSQNGSAVEEAKKVYDTAEEVGPHLPEGGGQTYYSAEEVGPHLPPSSPEKKGVDGLTQIERDQAFVNAFKADSSLSHLEKGDYVYTPNADRSHVNVMSKAAAIEQGIIPPPPPPGDGGGGTGASTPNLGGGPATPTTPGGLGQPGASGGQPGATTATGTPGGPVQVVVAGGTLDEVKAGNMAVGGLGQLEQELQRRAVSEQADTVQQAEQLRKQHAGNAAVESAAAQVIASGGQDQQAVNGLVNAVNAANGNKTYHSSLGQAVEAQNAKLREASARATDMMQLADQSIKTLEAEPNGAEKHKAKIEEWTKFRDSWSKADPIALSMGENFEKMDALMKDVQMQAVRTGADIQPGLFKSAGLGFVSGVMGSLGGAGSGLNRIPIIGPAISESLNEFHEAPERMRAWRAAGGFWKHWDASTNAKKLGYYQKASAPIAAGQQYEEMQKVGAFQAQVDIARQAASEAVARSRSNYEVMQYKTTLLEGNIGKDKNGLARGFLNAEELRGLGTLDSINRVNTIRAEALHMNGGETNVLVARPDKDDKTGKKWTIEEGKVSNNIAMFDDMASGLSLKKASGNAEDMLVSHYGLHEKRFFRGGKWDGTTNLGSRDADAREFMRMDADSDYLASGHVKMRQGKEKFFGVRGEYAKLVELTNREAMQKIELEASFDKAKLNGQLQDLLKGSAGGVELAAQIGTLDDSKLKGKFVSEQLKVDGALSPIFEVAYKRGAAGYDLKSRGAKMMLTEIDEKVQRDLEKLYESYAKTLKVSSYAFKDGTLRNIQTGQNVSIPKSVEAVREKAKYVLESRGYKGADLENAANLFLESMLQVLNKREDIAGKAFNRNTEDDGTVVTTASKEAFKTAAEAMQSATMEHFKKVGEDMMNFINGVKADTIEMTESNPGYVIKGKKGSKPNYVSDDTKFKDGDVRK